LIIGISLIPIVSSTVLREWKRNRETEEVSLGKGG